MLVPSRPLYFFNIVNAHHWNKSVTMSSFLIRDVRLFDGDKVVETASVLVENGLIVEVGSKLNKLRDGIPVISKPGHTLVPGLIEAHCHPYGNPQLPEQCLRFGITTVMDMHNVHEHAVQQKQWAKERKDFPDIKSSHYAATISGGWPEFVEKKLSKDGVSLCGMEHLC